MVEQDAAAAGLYAGGRILGQDELERFEKDAAEEPQLGISLPELGLHERPCEGIGPLGIDTAEALGEPFVDVEGKGVVLQGGDGPVVERHGVPDERFVVLLAQLDVGRPKRVLALVLGIPKIGRAHV